MTSTECRYIGSWYWQTDIDEGLTLPSRAARAAVNGDGLREALVTNAGLDAAGGAAHRDHIRSRYVIRRTA